MRPMASRPTLPARQPDSPRPTVRRDTAPPGPPLATGRVERWRPDVRVRGIEFGRPSSDPRRPLAMFPDRTFLQLLFGFRALEELETTFPDCLARTNEARALIEALFPKIPSDVWPVI